MNGKSAALSAKARGVGSAAVVYAHNDPVMSACTNARNSDAEIRDILDGYNDVIVDHIVPIVEAEIAKGTADPITTAMTFTMRPRPAGSIARTATSRVMQNVPLRLLRTTASKPRDERFESSAPARCPRRRRPSSSIRMAIKSPRN